MAGEIIKSSERAGDEQTLESNEGLVEGRTKVGSFSNEPGDGSSISDAVEAAQGQQQNTGGDSTTNTNTESGTSVVKTGEYPAPPQVEGESDLIEYLEQARDANRRLTPDEVEKLRRKQRTEAIVSSISDAVRSLSNLYFTSQYAPNMYDHSKGMSEATKARWDKTQKEREAENDRFLNYALKINGIRAKRAATEYQYRQDKIKADREDIKLSIAQAKADMEAAKADVWMQVQQGRMGKDAAAAELARIQSDYAKEHGMLMGKLSIVEHRGQGSGGGGGGRGSTPYSLTVYGETENYNKSDERKTAIYKYARELGIPITVKTGKWPNVKEVARNINDIAADIERATQGKKRPNPKVNSSDGKGKEDKNNNKKIKISY